jgi:hypothetical protein
MSRSSLLNVMPEADRTGKTTLAHSQSPKFVNVELAEGVSRATVSRSGLGQGHENQLRTAHRADVRDINMHRFRVERYGSDAWKFRCTAESTCCASIYQRQVESRHFRHFGISYVEIRRKMIELSSKPSVLALRQ